MLRNPKSPTVLMVQVLPAVWEVQSGNGEHVLTRGIIAGNVTEATDYIKKYVSSYNWWTWEIKPLDSYKRK